MYKLLFNFVADPMDIYYILHLPYIIHIFCAIKLVTQGTISNHVYYYIEISQSSTILVPPDVEKIFKSGPHFKFSKTKMQIKFKRFKKFCTSGGTKMVWTKID